ncbi:helix-turn-helix domain-containing protein [Novosphingobium barchaimii]|uniref:helix-turn-helix domain-containing protein n=1 Tax=Novosphingobium barchaimii TaxID=1420591 RepID=UPI00146FCD6B|nr:helix-turn-helix transcriptional regulator [Novosphingobium barchaimii]
MTIELDRTAVMPLNAAPPLSPEDLDDACFRARDRAWAAVYGEFLDREEAEGLTYAALGERINKPRSQIHRWMSGPSNLSIASLGLLAEGMNADLEISLLPRSIPDAGRNHAHPLEDAVATVISKKPLVFTNTSSFKMKIIKYNGIVALEV